MKIATVNFIAALSVAAQLLGCSAFDTIGESSFSCPGMPQGVICKTPTAVYKSTNGALPTAQSDLPMGEASAKAGYQKKTPPAILPVNAVNNAKEPSSARIKTPLPVRASAQVMRIWIAPWTDRNDDLHMPSFVFTEIQARKWNLGAAEFIGNGVAIPHRVMELAPGNSAGPGGSRASGKQDATNSAAATPQPQDDLNLGE